ncbi:MAG: GntR family transcriptional regulator [Victivallales bacterium]|nr:GntR family transcriptional regulator [Victivallales bacterium]
MTCPGRMKIDLNVLWKTPNAPPLYRQLKELVRSAILAGVYPPGTRLESEREFMRDGQLSYPTVSRALRELCEEGLVERTVGRGTFVCEVGAPCARIRRIAAFYYNLDTPYFRRLRVGLEAECGRLGVELTCLASGMTPQNELESWERGFSPGGYDALLGYPFSSMDLNLRLARMVDQGFPVMMVGSFFSQFQCDSVSLDYAQAGECAAGHLLDSGCHELVHIGVSPKFPFNSLEVFTADGMREALRQRNLPTSRYQRLNVTLAPGQPHSANYGETLLDLVKHGARPGVLCDSDLLARDVVDFLIGKGVKPPKEASVIGSGDLPEYSLAHSPQLSVIHWPLEQLGQHAVRRLAHQRQRHPGNAWHLLLEAPLIHRETTMQNSLP